MSISLNEIRNRLPPILRSHGVRRAAVFGSTARGAAGPASDLDLLVEFESGRSLLDLVGLRSVLRELLGRDADVVTFASLHPALRDSVLREQVEIL
jgi:uncharacterized protein